MRRSWFLKDVVLNLDKKREVKHMNMKKLMLIVVLALLIVGVAAVLPAGATHVAPIFVAGNPSCATLNADNANFPTITSDFGFKLNGAPTGTFTLTNPPGELTGGAQPDPNNSVTISNFENSALGQIFDWAATLGIDAVIVKGGPNANAYVYDPEAFGDDDLHAPVNPANDQYFDISHIEFCYDYEVTVSKTANTTFTRTFNWTIEKSVTPETWDLFTGDSGTSEYTVEVTKGDGVDSDWAVNGTITIENNTPFAATIESVSDTISGFGAVAVNCGVSFPHVLVSGDSLECTYSTSLPDGSDRTNTATVTTSGAVGGGSADADVIFGDPTTVVNDTINVDDTYAGDLGSFSDSGSTSYPRTFTCDDDEGTHDNTATIVETGQSDDASVTVNCYALTVDKDADTALNRTWTWTIEKSADQTDLLLSEGQLFQVNYQVTVDASSTDSDHAVSGNISVHNPAPIDATLNSVADVVSPNIAADVECGVTFPYTLAADDTLNCTYSADLPDDADRTNTATATLQNYDYDSAGVGTPSGTSDFTGSANVDFSGATVTEVDECVDVNDTNVGFLGTVCAADAPKTFEYSLWFGAHPDADVVLECGENTHTNIASFETNDTGTTDEDDETVNAVVECAVGCTLTQGYWKTHSHHGPAPEDDAWFNLGDVDGDGTSEGADENFFKSGKTYYQILWTAPAGNAYYILAHQYIAAELNFLNGADPTAAQAAFDAATTLFNTYTPAQIGALKGNNATRKLFLSLATTLDKYNNGLIGPGHCSE